MLNIILYLLNICTVIVSMWTLAFSSKHHCVQPHRAAMAVDLVLL